MSELVIKNLWKEYDHQIVLENISLTIASRSFVALVGPSGCGKSTFLRMLLGQELPTRGEILIDGTPLPREPGPDRGIVFQQYSTFPHLTVLQNVLLGEEFSKAGVTAKLFGAARRTALSNAKAIIDDVGLSESEHKYPSQLSGGMRQRLALAQALIKQPKVLLLDEPFGALDPGIRSEIHILMKRLWNQTQMTAVMVTHDLREAFTLASRVIAFERPRDRPEERERYGARITKDHEIWPPRIAGQQSLFDPKGVTN